MIVIVTGILLISILADVITRKIPNALIIAGLILGLLFNIINEGPMGLVCSLKEIVLAICLFYIFYLLRALGAGDVKLLIVLASFLGANLTTKILCVSLVLGSLYGCVRLIMTSLNSIEKRERRKEMIRELIYYINLRNFDLFCNQLKNLLIEKMKSKNFYRIPYSPFIFMATVLVWEWR